MNKKIVIAGGTGFIGNALENHFTNKRDTVLILTRNVKKSNHIYWDGENLSDWIDTLNGSDVLINLCGKSVDCRYTVKNKDEILNSRINPTKLLDKAMQIIDNPPNVWLNASSATIYENATKKLMTEINGVIGDDFSMGICKQWEDAFFKVKTLNVRKVALRLSIVFGKENGAFPKYKQITKLGLGGHQGNGKQLMSWIHIDDVCNAISFIIQNENIVGPVNVTSPNVVENRAFMLCLRRNLGIKLGLPHSRLMLEIGAFFLRTETELLLKSRNVYPEKLLNNGFQFNFQNIEDAVADLINCKQIKRRKGSLDSISRSYI